MVKRRRGEEKEGGEEGREEGGEEGGGGGRGGGRRMINIFKYF